MADDTETDPDHAAPAAPTEDVVEAAAQVLDDDLQARLWLRAIVPLLQLRTHESDPSDRVQYAFDKMHVAACERAARILGSDRPG